MYIERKKTDTAQPHEEGLVECVAGTHPMWLSITAGVTSLLDLATVIALLDQL
jgi:hypothetical protein